MQPPPPPPLPGGWRVYGEYKGWTIYIGDNILYYGINFMAQKDSVQSPIYTSYAKVVEWIDAQVPPPPPPPPPNGCFIATACYGSPTHTRVCQLRTVKNKLIQRSRWAKLFYRLYYISSPSIAMKIRTMQKTKAIVRNTIETVWRLLKNAKV